MENVFNNRQIDQGIQQLEAVIATVQDLTDLACNMEGTAEDQRVIDHTLNHLRHLTGMDIPVVNFSLDKETGVESLKDLGKRAWRKMSEIILAILAKARAFIAARWAQIQRMLNWISNSEVERPQQEYLDRSDALIAQLKIEPGKELDAYQKDHLAKTGGVVAMDLQGNVLTSEQVNEDLMRIVPTNLRKDPKVMEFISINNKPDNFMIDLKEAVSTVERLASIDHSDYAEYIKDLTSIHDRASMERLLDTRKERLKGAYMRYRERLGLTTRNRMHEWVGKKVLGNVTPRVAPRQIGGATFPVFGLVRDDRAKRNTKMPKFNARDRDEVRRAMDRLASAIDTLKSRTDKQATELSYVSDKGGLVAQRTVAVLSELSNPRTANDVEMLRKELEGLHRNVLTITGNGTNVYEYATALHMAMAKLYALLTYQPKQLEQAKEFIDSTESDPTGMRR